MITANLETQHMTIDKTQNKGALDIHNNMLQAWKSLSKSDEVDFIQTNQTILTVTSCNFNLVLEAHFLQQNDGTADYAEINKVNDMYRSKKLAYSWWVNSFSSPDNLTDSLSSYGLTSSGKITGMVMDLGKPPIRSYNNITNNTISLVSETEDYDIWIQPIEESFHMSQESASYFKNIYLTLGDNQHWSHIMAHKGQQPIASCSLFFDQSTGLAGIYSCATIVKERRKGIMSSIVIKALQMAYERGFERIVLQANPNSCSMFKKLGFVAASNYDVFVGNGVF